MINRICICGGGGQCHAIAPWLAARNCEVSILTGRPKQWSDDFGYVLPNGESGKVKLGKISSDPADVIPSAQVVLFTVPGFMNREELLRIKPYLTPGTMVGAVFSSNGFFFEALDVLPESIPLWGFQRVPFIARAKVYGHEGNILGLKSELHIATERCSHDKAEEFRAWLENMFEIPVILHGSHLEVSLSNSNPLLHTSRVYTMFRNWDGVTPYPERLLLYEQWTDEASDYLIAMDRELHEMIKHLPVPEDCLPSILDYYESSDASSLTRKIRSISAFKGLPAPMKQTEGGWIPDFDNRIFTEDFVHGLKKYVELAAEIGVDAPVMREVLAWRS